MTDGDVRRVTQEAHPHPVYFCEYCRRCYEPEEIDEYRWAPRLSSFDLAACPVCPGEWLSADAHVQACEGDVGRSIREKLGLSTEALEALWMPVPVGDYVRETVVAALCGRFGLGGNPVWLGEALARAGALTESEGLWLDGFV